jgi:hypothetical protein
MADTDPRITKKKVTMTNVFATADGTAAQVVTDYVREDFLEAYVSDARTKHQLVTVSDEYDAGPGGYDGATHVPEHLLTPLAGQTFAATVTEAPAQSPDQAPVDASVDLAYSEPVAVDPIPEV